MKILFVTDTHLTGRGPSSRTDNYVESIFEKLEELKAVIQKENIEAVIHGGDVFDKPVVSYQLTGMLASYIRSTGVPWHVVPGNHDLFGYNLKSLPQTSLGLLSESGVIDVLTRDSGPVEFTSTEGTTYSFEGQEYHMDIDKRDPALDYYVSTQADYKFLIPHSMLLDKDYFPGVPHTRTKDLAGKTDADFILVGHYHDGLTDTVKNGTKRLDILNPGSMTRDEASKGNLKRRPAYVTIDLAKSPTIEYHEFQCAKDGNDIFDRTHITNKQTKDRYLQAFEQQLEDAPVIATDIRTVLDGLIQHGQGTIESAVSDGARQRLVDAEQSITDATHQMAGFVEKTGNLSIARLRVKGFQSHEDTDVAFGPGLNAIIGSSDSGKSSLIRALRFALYNEPRGAEFIRHSATSAQVIVDFSDGSYLKRARTRASSGSYVIGLPDGTETEIKGFANQIPVDIPNTHQMPRIQLTKDLEATLSIGYQLDGAFLIGESPGTRAAIIGKLAGVDLVDSAMREIGKDLLGDTKDLKRLKEEKLEVTERLLDYADLEEEKLQLDTLTDTLKALHSKKEILDDLIQVDQDYRTETRSMVDAEFHVRQADQVLMHNRLLDSVVQRHQVLNNLKAAKADAATIDRDLTDATLQLAEAEHVLSAETALISLRGTVHALEAHQQLAAELAQANEEALRAEKVLAGLPVIPDTQQVAFIREKIRQRAELLALQEEYLAASQEIIRQQEAAHSHGMDEEEAQHAYQHILEQNGTCPTCRQTIIKGDFAHVN